MEDKDALIAKLQAELTSKEIQVTGLIAEVNYKQSVIDRLMLEFCPQDMTRSQVAEWMKHQVPNEVVSNRLRGMKPSGPGYYTRSGDHVIPMARDLDKNAPPDTKGDQTEDK